MNVWDIVVVAVLAAALLLAFRAVRRGKAGSCSCCSGSCAACPGGCGKKDGETKRDGRAS